MIATLLSDLIPWLVIVGGALIAFLGYGRHQKGQGRDEARKEATIRAAENLLDREGTRQNVEAEIRRPDQPSAVDRLRESEWTRDGQ